MVGDYLWVLLFCGVIPILRVWLVILGFVGFGLRSFLMI